jgi:hypothetical protein
MEVLVSDLLNSILCEERKSPKEETTKESSIPAGNSLHRYKLSHISSMGPKNRHLGIPNVPHRVQKPTKEDCEQAAAADREARMYMSSLADM